MITSPHIVAVLEAAGQGRCDVSPDALAAHRALGRITEARRAAGIGIATARTALELPVAKLLDDLGAGIALTPDYFEQVHQDVQAAEKAKVLAQLIDAAEGQAQWNVTSSIESDVAGIIASLEPRLLNLLDETRPLVEQLGDTPRTESAVMRAPDGRARKAWLALDDQGAKYEQMRALYVVLLSLDGSRTGGPQLQCFGVIRDVPAHWEDWQPNTPEAVPWPADPGKFLLWCVDHQAQPWMPTPRQLERAIAAAAAARRDAMYADAGSEQR